MNEVIYFGAFCLVATLFGIFVPFRWLRITCVVVLFAASLFQLSIGMSGLRPHIEEARRKGASEDFIDGMVARDRRLLRPRVEVFFGLAGFFALALVAAASQRPKKLQSPD